MFIVDLVPAIKMRERQRQRQRQRQTDRQAGRQAGREKDRERMRKRGSLYKNATYSYRRTFQIAMRTIITKSAQ